MGPIERRQDDHRIDELIILVKEIHQRQNEVTLPTLNEIKETLYARGGICETIHQHTGNIKELDDRINKIPLIVSWVLAGVSVGAGTILWLNETFFKAVKGG